MQVESVGDVFGAAIVALRHAGQGVIMHLPSGWRLGKMWWNPYISVEALGRAAWEASIALDSQLLWWVASQFLRF